MSATENQTIGRPCVFCGRTGEPSREHILPDWIKEFVPDPGKAMWTVTQTTEIEGEPRNRQFPVKPYEQVVKHVCDPCNTGWMSRLEGGAKPWLAPMILGRGKHLHETGQTLASVWALKTAMMWQQTYPKGSLNPLPSEHFEWLYAHRERGGARVSRHREPLRG